MSAVGGRFDEFVGIHSRQGTRGGVRRSGDFGQVDFRRGNRVRDAVAIGIAVRS